MSEILTHFRRAISLKREIFCMPEMKAMLHVLESITQVDVAASHAFDFGESLDRQASSFIGVTLAEALTKEADALRSRMAFFLPHQKVIYICRTANPFHLEIYVAQHYVGEIIFHVFSYAAPNPQWGWVASVSLSTDTDGIDALAKGISPPGKEAEYLAVYNVTFLTATVLLLLKKDTEPVILEPAEWLIAAQPSKPKAFQMPHPSQSIVRVNTQRILRLAADEDGSGATVRPHDRRAHLRRRGWKIIKVKESKIHGGAPSSVMKTVKIEE
jgi:hypothetical protein